MSWRKPGKVVHMSDPMRAICLQHGVFLRREALEAGYDEKSITALYRAGVFHRVRHGAYTHGDTWQAASVIARHAITARAVLRTAKAPVVLSHVSAAVEHAVPIWDLPLHEVHTTRIGGHGGRREAGVRHHQGLLIPEDIHCRNGVPVTSPTRTAVDLALMTDVEHALVPINAMLHTGLLDEDDFLEQLDRAERWPGALSSHVVRRMLNRKCESPGETRTDYFIWANRLPTAVCQYEIRAESGLVVARVDFAWPQHGVFLEFDGRVKYKQLLRPGDDASDVVVREKLREQRICELTGWRCIRITWTDLNDPATLARRLRRMLEGGPAYTA